MHPSEQHETIPNVSPAYPGLGALPCIQHFDSLPTLHVAVKLWQCLSAQLQQHHLTQVYSHDRLDICLFCIACPVYQLILQPAMCQDVGIAKPVLRCYWQTHRQKTRQDTSDKDNRWLFRSMHTSRMVTRKINKGPTSMKAYKTSAPSKLDFLASLMIACSHTCQCLMPESPSVTAWWPLS